jgi:long-chain acyl-CoA synthetase
MNCVMTHLSERASARFGNAIALITDDRTMTFDEVNDEASRFAGGLAAIGIKAGDRVILHLVNQWEWVVAYHAIARVGAVVIPANFLLSAEEVAYIAVDCQASVVIAPLERCLAIQASDKVEVQHFIYPDEDRVQSVASAPLFNPYSMMLDHPPLRPVTREPQDLFSIGYTSGTTGAPKGAMLSHRAVYTSTALTATLHVRHQGERVVSALPFPHVYGNVVLQACFLVGMTLITTARFAAEWALDAIARHQATMFEGVPTMYYYMLGHQALSTTDFSSLIRCTVGGQNLPANKHDEITDAFGCPLLELWGMTELAGPALTHSPYIQGPAGSVGQVMPGLEVRIVSDADPTLDLPQGEAGEMLVRGPTVMSGYFGKVDASAQTLLAEGWLRTGDIACVDRNGYVWIVDRLKDMIITAGYKIYPAEIEQVLSAHPDVAMAAVVSLQDELKGEIAKAFIVPTPGVQLDESQILDYCRRELATYKVPKSVEFVNSLPTTPSGKILRRHLRTSGPSPTN